MSSVSIDRLSGAAMLLRGWTPLYEWSPRRRMAVAGVIAVAAGALATLACITSDFAGSAAAKAALAVTRREFADGQHAQRALPALRQAAAVATRSGPRPGNHSADDARYVSELAAASGISLVSLEPGAPGGHGAEAFRVIKLSAQGDFARLRAFLHRLAYAPILIVPIEAAIKRNGPNLSLAATLSVFDALPSLPGGDANDNAATPSDPFAANLADGASAVDGLRLAGLLQDRTRAVALIETPHGTDAVERGGRIEDERVAHIGRLAVTLAAGGSTRELKLMEDGK